MGRRITRRPDAEEPDEANAAQDATRTASDEIEAGATHSLPARVGRYEICEVLGAGAMNVAYRVYDPELDRSEAFRHYLVPSWSPAGELMVRALGTGQYGALRKAPAS